MELGPQNHKRDGLLGSNSIVAVYMDPLGNGNEGYGNELGSPGLYKGAVAACHKTSTANTKDPAIQNNVKYTHRPLSSSFLGLPYRILTMNHKKEQLRSLWADTTNPNPLTPKPASPCPSIRHPPGSRV